MICINGKLHKLTAKTNLITLGNTGWRSADFRGSYPRIIEALLDFRQHTKGWENEQHKEFLKLLVEREIVQKPKKVSAKDGRLKTSFLSDIGLVTISRINTLSGESLLETTQVADQCDNPFLIADDSWIYLRQLLLYRPTDRQSSRNLVDYRPIRNLIYLCLKTANHLTVSNFKTFWHSCTSQVELDQALEDPEFSEDSDSISDLISIIKVKDQSTEAIANIQMAEGLNTLDLTDDDTISPDNPLYELLLSLLPHGKGDKFKTEPIKYIHELMTIWIHIRNSEGQNRVNHQRALITCFNKLCHIFKLKAEQIREMYTSLNLSDDEREVLSEDQLDTFCQWLGQSPPSHLRDIECTTFTNSSIASLLFNVYLLWKVAKLANNLDDYVDLNLRQLSLLDIFSREGNQIKLTPLAYQVFLNAYPDPSQLFADTEAFDASTTWAQYREYLENIQRPSEETDPLLQRIYVASQQMSDQEKSTLKTENQKRFLNLIKEVYTTESLIELFGIIHHSNDDYKSLRVWLKDRDIIYQASGPAFSEYIVGLFWYHLLQRDQISLPIEKILNCNLDGNFLPVTHAAGRQADLSFEWNGKAILTEITLSAGNTQRQMEAEPVPRHLAKYIFDSAPEEALSIFIAPSLDPNNLVILRAYLNLPWYDPTTYTVCPASLKIIPLCFDDLKKILNSKKGFSTVYETMLSLISHSETDGYRWYEDQIKPYVW